jgi:hypothetical protein
MASPIFQVFKRALADTSPNVMASSLPFFLSKSTDHPESLSALVPTFCYILDQIFGGRMPVEWMYHGCLAPWIQVSLIRVLSRMTEFIK